MPEPLDRAWALAEARRAAAQPCVLRDGESGRHGKEAITVRHVLRHLAGLPVARRTNLLVPGHDGARHFSDVADAVLAAYRD